jgi:glucose-6-phosphate isomerase
MEPYVKHTDMLGMMESPDRSIIRRMADIAHLCADAQSAQKLVDSGNPVIYEMLEAHVPETPGEIAFCTTRMYPGLIGNEYYMTKGHFHVDMSTAEIYYTYSGHGVLLAETKDKQTELIDMPKGSIVHVEPGWAHRTYNIGDEPLVFLAAYPATAGHDYSTIEKDGFSHTVIKGENGPELVPSPRFRT